MADNTQVIDPKKTLTTIPGDTIATDDITQFGSVAKGAKVQRVKVGLGKDGEYGDLTEDNPLPVETVGTPTASERLLSEMLLQMRFTNQYLAMIVNNGELLTEEDIDIDISNNERV